MARWSVILFPYDAPGKRMKKGDIITLFPVGHNWSPGEEAGHEIVIIDGVTLNQTAALTERIFDLDSYILYEPISLEEFITINKLEKELSLKQVELYAHYIKAQKDRSAYPTQYLNKRRFSVGGSGNLTKIDIYDNMKKRNVFIDDKLETIKAVKV